MKDMLGIKLKEGQHVFYFYREFGNTVHEEAKIVKVRVNSIRVEFLGNILGGKKNKGQFSNVFDTKGKIFVFSKDVGAERLAFIDKIDDLMEENWLLKKEVDQIHYRSDILDL